MILSLYAYAERVWTVFRALVRAHIGSCEDGKILPYYVSGEELYNLPFEYYR